MDTKNDREENPQVLLNGMPAASMNGPFTTGMKPPEMPAAVIGTSTFCKTPTRQVLIAGKPVPTISNRKPGA